MTAHTGARPASEPWVLDRYIPHPKKSAGRVMSKLAARREPMVRMRTLYVSAETALERGLETLESNTAERLCVAPALGLCSTPLPSPCTDWRG